MVDTPNGKKWDWVTQNFRVKQESRRRGDHTEWITISSGRGKRRGVTIHLEPPIKISHAEIEDKLLGTLALVKKHARRYLREGRPVEICLQLPKKGTT